MNEKINQEHNTHGSSSQLISANTLAELLSVSKRTLSRLQSKGELPPPIRLGRTIRWRVDVVNKWVARGCPPWNTLS